MSTIAITATRSVLASEPRIHQALYVIHAAGLVDKVIVGAARGGDCQAAQAAIALGFTVHTVVPGDWGQLCPHWREFVTTVGVAPPHTTTHELMKREAGSIAYRHRNERMVGLADAGLLAFPNHSEQAAYSGVTMTINIARRLGKPVQSVRLHD